MVMSLQDRQLILSLPVSACADPAAPVSPPPPSPILPKTGYGNDDDRFENQFSIVIAYGTTLWKKLRGLSRLKDLSRHYSNLPWEANIGVEPLSSLEYLRSRHDALDRFLTQSVGSIDEEFY
eukprot:jgi/Psemu1/315563/fgenesh1_kg.2227_\